jgi:hypothetical protein
MATWVIVSYCGPSQQRDGFELPNPMDFLRRISKADNYDIQTRTLGMYLMETSLLNSLRALYPTRMIHTPMMAAAGILNRKSAQLRFLHFGRIAIVR